MKLAAISWAAPIHTPGGLFVRGSGGESWCTISEKLDGIDEMGIQSPFTRRTCSFFDMAARDFSIIEVSRSVVDSTTKSLSTAVNKQINFAIFEYERR